MAKKTGIHVVPRPNGHWAVERGGAERASKVTRTQQQAITAGKKIAVRRPRHGRPPSDDGTLRPRSGRYGRRRRYGRRKRRRAPGAGNQGTGEPSDAGTGPGPSDGCCYDPHYADVGAPVDGGDGRPYISFADLPSKMLPPPIPVTLVSEDGATCTTSSLCAQPWTHAPLPSTVDAFAAAIVGTWALCGPVSAFYGSDQGLEIDADRTWYRLYVVNGVLTRGQGIADHGTWELIELGGSLGLTYQLNFTYLGPGLEGGGGLWLSQPALGTNPRALRIEQGMIMDYVLAACP